MAKKSLRLLLIPACGLALLAGCGHSPKRNSANSPYLSQSSGYLVPSAGLPVMTAPATR